MRERRERRERENQVASFQCIFYFSVETIEGQSKFIRSIDLEKLKREEEALQKVLHSLAKLQEQVLFLLFSLFLSLSLSFLFLFFCLSLSLFLSPILHQFLFPDATEFDRSKRRLTKKHERKGDAKT